MSAVSAVSALSPRQSSNHDPGLVLVSRWWSKAKYKTALSIVLSHIGPLWSRQLRLLNLKHLLHISVLNTLPVATQSDGTYGSATVDNIK